MKKIFTVIILLFGFQCFSQNCELNVSISCDTSLHCYGQSPGIITALITGGSSSKLSDYEYFWYRNDTLINDSTYYYYPGNITDTTGIYLIVYDSICGYDTSNLITLNVYDQLIVNITGPDSVNINQSPGTLVCIATGGSGVFTYLWYRDGISTGVTTPQYNPGPILQTTVFMCVVNDASLTNIIIDTVNSNDSITALLDILNPSFEGIPQPHILPDFWDICLAGVTPDTQPGSWGCTLPASDGNTYVGLVSQPQTGWQEGASQKLLNPMVGGQIYNYSIDLATMASADPTTGIELPPYCATLQIWGGMSIGNSGCDQSQLLWESPVITDSVWQKHYMSFTPDSAWHNILFLIKTQLPACTDGQYILMDNFAPSSGSCGIGTVGKTIIVRQESAIAEINNSGFKVFPNPCSDYLYFENASYAEIYDYTGMLILSTTIKENRLNVSSLDNGLYLFIITDINNKRHFGKFEKMKN